MTVILRGIKYLHPLIAVFLPGIPRAFAGGANHHLSQTRLIVPAKLTNILWNSDNPWILFR